MNKNDAESVIKDTIEYANNEIRKNKEKSKRVVIASLASAALLMVIVLFAVYGYYIGGNIGIPEDRINLNQINTVSWNEHDYGIIGASADGSPLYVGVMYMNDYSDAKYFIYVKRKGISIGWHFFQSGSICQDDGIQVFDCGKYGTAYVALNSNGAVKKIEFTDGREPSVFENIGGVICEQSETSVIFYDGDGNVMECNRQTLVR